MKLAHIADLHIGKIVNGFSMIDEQRYVLSQIVENIKKEHIESLMIAGDIYDKRNPSDEAVSLFNTFLSDLSKLNINIFIISGNHDSGVKLGFGCEILEKQNVYIVGSYKGHLDYVELYDEYGPLKIYMLPFVRVSDVRVFNDAITTYHDAIRYIIEKEDIDYSKRNIIMSHQFYSSGLEERSESEIISVGGIDNVGYNLLLDFDYVALGHLHKPQSLKVETIRYSGSPIKYSLSEVNDQKAMVIINLREKDNLSLDFISLSTQKQFVVKKGYLDDLLKEEASDDYMFITLFDDHVIDAIGKLRIKYPNLMTLDFDNKRTKSDQIIYTNEEIEEASPLELFEEFYKLQNNDEINNHQRDIIKTLLERIDENASN